MLFYATKNMIFSKKNKMKNKEKTVEAQGAAVTVEAEEGAPPAPQHTFAPISTTTILPTAASTSSRDGTETGYSDGGKDVDLVSAEKPEVKGAVAA